MLANQILMMRLATHLQLFFQILTFCLMFNFYLIRSTKYSLKFFIPNYRSYKRAHYDHLLI